MPIQIPNNVIMGKKYIVHKTVIGISYQNVSFNE